MVATTLAATLLATSRDAEAVVVERVVAVVGEKAILLTELRERARPFVRRIYATVPAGPSRAAQESEVLARLIERMVEEKLEALAAARSNTRATAEEVDKALANIARAGKMPLSKLYENILRETGVSEAEYRREIRRQVLEGKLLSRMAQNQRVTPKEVKEMYERIVTQERAILLYRPSWIVLRLDKHATKKKVAARMKQASDLVEQARKGADFAALAKQFSDDSATAGIGGDLNVRAVARSPKAATGRHKLLASSIERRALRLKVNQIADPFRFQDAIIVLKITSRQPSRYTSLQAARREMVERVRGEKLQKIKKKWLKNLRQQTHTTIRL